MGETGVGKSLVAQMLYGGHGPYVVVDAASLTGPEAERHLFGVHGAMLEESPQGLWAQAQGGVLHIDEITNLSRSLQVGLSRALDTQTAARKADPCKQSSVADVRVIATTRQNMDTVSSINGLREDLFGRLSTCLLLVPPLRDRPEDIIPLAEHCINELGRRDQLPLNPALVAFLQRQTWSGNVLAKK